MKVLSYETKSLAKKGATCWFIALFATFILTIKNLVIHSKKIIALQMEIASIKGSPKINEKFDAMTQAHKKQK